MKAKVNVTPIWIEKLKDGSESFTDVFARLIKDRTIFLTGEITQESAAVTIALLLLLDNQDNENDITIWLYSDGGDAQGFFAIYDVMQLIKSPVSTICVGNASSAAALLLSAGTPGKRCALPNSSVMIHQIQISGEITGTGTEVENEMGEVKKLNKRLFEILAAHSGQTFAKVKRDCIHDKYLNAEEAKEYGIIDVIMKPTKIIPEINKKPKPKKA